MYLIKPNMYYSFSEDEGIKNNINSIKGTTVHYNSVSESEFSLLYDGYSEKMYSDKQLSNEISTDYISNGLYSRGELPNYSENYSGQYNNRFKEDTSLPSEFMGWNNSFGSSGDYIKLYPYYLPDFSTIYDNDFLNNFSDLYVAVKETDRQTSSGEIRVRLNILYCKAKCRSDLLRVTSTLSIISWGYSYSIHKIWCEDFTLCDKNGNMVADEKENYEKLNEYIVPTYVNTITIENERYLIYKIQNPFYTYLANFLLPERTEYKVEKDWYTLGEPNYIKEYSTTSISPYKMFITIEANDVEQTLDESYSFIINSDKVVSLDKNSFQLNQNKLLQQGAKYGDETGSLIDIQDKIANDIFNKYYKGRKVATLEWIGHPDIKIGDTLKVVPDKNFNGDLNSLTGYKIIAVNNSYNNGYKQTLKLLEDYDANITNFKINYISSAVSVKLGDIELSKDDLVEYNSKINISFKSSSDKRILVNGKEVQNNSLYVVKSNLRITISD